MTKQRRDALLAMLASGPLFWRMIDGSMSLKDMIMIGLAVAIAAGVVLAVPVAGDDSGED